MSRLISSSPSCLHNLKLFNLLLFFLILAVRPSHTHRSSSNCETQCSPEATDSSTTIQKFQAGFTYSYAYEIESSAQLFKINNEDKAQSSVKGYAYLTVISPCYFHLKLTGLKSYNWLAGSEANTLTRINLPESSIRFRMENDTVVQICKAQGDPSWSVNLKKSILYLFQLAHMDSTGDFDTHQIQDDLSGRCPVRIQRQGNVIYKTKDLNSCSGRQFGRTFQHGVQYDTLNSNLQGLPILNSRASCKHELYQGIIQSAICSEENDLKSIAPDGPTVMMSTKNFISFIQARKRSSSQPASLYISTSLHYEWNPNPASTTNQTTSSATRTLELLCSELSTDDLMKDSPANYLQLKSLLKSMDKQAVASISQQIASGSTCSNPKLEKIFKKTLIQATSDGAIAFVADLMTSGRLEEELELEFLNNLAFADAPGIEALASVGELLVSIGSGRLDSKKIQVLLSASGMAFQYCKLNENCGAVPEYIAVVDTLAAFVTRSLDYGDQASAVASLESLGNLGVLTKKAEIVIGNVLKSKSNRIRVRGLGAFRRDPCRKSLKSFAKRMLGDLKMGSDVRIHAYLAVYRCLEAEDLQGFQAVIDNEQSNQVSSYLHSHISNQLESSSQSKSPLKSLLRKLHLDKDLPKTLNSVGKFSKNIEWSSPDLLGTGAAGTAIESDIVYSQDSYIPRSASINLTLDLFGHSFNYLEAGVYLENFENLLSKFNAPKDLEESAANLTNEVSKRSSRVNPTDLQQITNRIDIKGRYLDEGAGDTFLRKYGTTISVSSFTQADLPGLFDVVDVSKIIDWEGLIEMLRNSTVERIKPSHFIDEEIIVATTSGVPIRLKLQGSSVFSSRYEFNVDLASMWINNDGGDGRENSFKILPNVASTISLGVSVGPEVHEVGFEFDAKTHLSAAAHFSFSKAQKGVRLSYHFPISKFRAVEFDGNLFWTSNEALKRKKVELKPPMVIRSRHDTYCTKESSKMFGLVTPEAVGLKYCYLVRMPKFSLKKIAAFGPMTFRMTSEKLDEAMRGFTLDIHSDGSDSESAIVVVVDAPGSSANRRVAIRASYTEEGDAGPDEVTLKLEYPSVLSPLLIKAQLLDGNLKGITGSMLDVQGKEFKFNATVAIETNGNNQEIYLPLIATSSSSGDTKKYLSGELVRDVGRSLRVNLLADLLPFGRPTTLIGLILADRSPNGNFNLTLTKGQLKSENLQVNLTGSLYNAHPSVGIQLTSTVQRNEIKSDLALASEITIIPSSKFALKTKSASSSLPQLNIDFDLLTEFNSSSNGSQITLQSRLGNHWDVLAIRRAGDTWGSLEVHADVARFKRKLELFTRRNHVDLDDLTEFDFASHLKWDAGRDEAKRIAVNFGFVVDGRATDVTRYGSSNSIVFIGSTHSINLSACSAKNTENGEYSASASYKSPQAHLYAFNYSTIFSTLNSTRSADNRFNLQFHPLPILAIKWTKELTKPVEETYSNFQASTKFVVHVGHDSIVELKASAVGESSSSVNFYPQKTTAGMTLSGSMAPIHITMSNRLRLYFNESLEVTMQVSENPASLAEGVKAKNGTLMLRCRPDRKGSERWYNLDLSWTPKGPYVFAVEQFSFTNDVSVAFGSRRNFTVRSDGLLTLSRGVTAWSKTLNVTAEKIDTRFSVKLPTSTVALSLTSGIETDASCRYLIFYTTSAINNRPSFNFNLKIDIENPLRLFNTSLLIQNLIAFSLENKLFRNDTSDTYRVLAKTSVPDALLDTEFTHQVQLTSEQISVESGVQVLIGTHVNINGLFQGQLTKVGTDSITEIDVESNSAIDVDSTAPDRLEKWYVQMQYNRRNGPDEEPVLKCYGPLFRSKNMVKSTVLMEWPTIHHSFILIRLHAERNETNRKNATVILNLSGFDKRGNLVDELEKVPESDRENLLDENSDAAVYANFKIYTNDVNIENNGRKLSLNFESKSSVNLDFPTDLEFNLIRSDILQECRFESTSKIQDRIQIFSSIASLKNQDGYQEYQLLSRRNESKDFEIVDNNVEISTGLIWKNQNVDGGIKKKLCFMAEKVVGPEELFETCTLGFNSNEESTATGRIRRSKFTLLDRIAFESNRIDDIDWLAVNASFWLDIIDKPEEELRFSVKKRTIVQDGHRADSKFFGEHHASEFEIAAQHPFLSKSLHGSFLLGPDTTDWNQPTVQLTANLDVFEREEDRLIISLKKSEDGAKKNAEVDDYFYGFDNDYSAPEDSGPAGASVYQVSVHSDGLRLKFEAEGKSELSSGLKYSYLNRNGELVEGSAILRIPSLLDSTVLQLGSAPIISVGFDGFPRVHINDLISNESLIMEYHISPVSVRLFTTNFPPEEFYSIVIPPTSDEELTIRLQMNRDEMTQIIASGIAALNTSKLLQLRAAWSNGGLEDTMMDLKSLKSSVATALKRDLAARASETSENVKHFAISSFRALPNIQPLLAKLDREIQEDLEEVRRESNFAYEFISNAILESYALAKQSVGKLSLLLSRLKEKAEEAKVTDWAGVVSKIKSGWSYIKDETLGAVALGVSKLKLKLQEMVDRAHQFVEENPEFKEFFEDVRDVTYAGKTMLEDALRVGLEKTILLRPYLRWFVPSEVHEFLITLKQYSLGKLADESSNEASEVNLTMDDVLRKAYSTVLVVGRKVLEGQGWMFHAGNESALLQFPLPKPARKVYQVLSTAKLPRLRYSGGLRQLYDWLTSSQLYDTRSGKLSKLKARLENAFFGGIGPSDSLAYIVAGKFYRTFDGKFHTFDGSCQYILAGDFLVENLTILTEGESDQREIIFESDGHTVTITQNASVMYNGQDIYVPLTESLAEVDPTSFGPFDAFHYDTLGGDIGVSKRYSGLAVACLTKYPICTVRLKSYLYGRSKGLLGTNNLESYDEFSLPHGEIVGKTSSFYRNWRVNNKECGETKGSLAKIEPLAEVKARCASYFEDELSPFRACFSVVHPQDFKEICQDYAMTLTNQTEYAACTIASLYWIECNEQQVFISDDSLSQCNVHI